jgi:hypothetical protein
MNILSRIDWRALASELPEMFASPTVQSLDILQVLGKRELIGVDVEDLGRVGDDDPELFGVLDGCVLGISDDTESWNDVTAPAVAIDQRPRTWLEAHRLNDARWLVLPGEATEIPTFSFWMERPRDGRPMVASFIADASRRISGVLFHRSKQCQEDFQRTGVCAGVVHGCECTSSKSFEGPIVIDICSCG